MSRRRLPFGDSMDILDGKQRSRIAFGFYQLKVENKIRGVEERLEQLHNSRQELTVDEFRRKEKYLKAQKRFWEKKVGIA